MYTDTLSSPGFEDFESDQDMMALFNLDLPDSSSFLFSSDPSSHVFFSLAEPLTRDLEETVGEDEKEDDVGNKVEQEEREKNEKEEEKEKDDGKEEELEKKARVKGVKGKGKGKGKDKSNKRKRDSIDGPSAGASISTARTARRTRTKTKVSTLPDPSPAIESEAPTWIGNFDLYAMSLPFLLKIYLPNTTKSAPPEYSALYDKLLLLQSRPDYTARCYLAPPPWSPVSIISSPRATSAAVEGRFMNPTMINPTTFLPFDVSLHALSANRGMAMNVYDKPYFPGLKWMPHTSGICGKVGMAGSLAEGIVDTKGTFKMKRVWSRARADADAGGEEGAEKEGGKVDELFEGIFSFNVKYNGAFKEAGQDGGSYDRYKYAFWAIRAKKDGLGREIGLGPRVDVESGIDLS